MNIRISIDSRERYGTILWLYFAGGWADFAGLWFGRIYTGSVETVRQGSIWRSGNLRPAKCDGICEEDFTKKYRLLPAIIRIEHRRFTLMIDANPNLGYHNRQELYLLKIYEGRCSCV